jgi:tetratricopeptide (TPR) repeat protein
LDNLTTERIKLIYEFNKNSPLFTRVAAAELQKGNYQEANKILEEGINIHSFYPTAFLLLSLCKAYEGKETEAKIVAKVGSDLINSKETYDYYCKKIEEIIEERKSISETSRPNFLEENNSSNEETIESKLDILAEQLSKAKIIPKVIDDNIEPEIPEFKGKKIVSETLAEIYFSQKNYEDALSAYEELINQKPEKAEYYLNRIDEIKSRMNS